MLVFFLFAVFIFHIYVLDIYEIMNSFELRNRSIKASFFSRVLLWRSLFCLDA